MVGGFSDVVDGWGVGTHRWGAQSGRGGYHWTHRGVGGSHKCSRYLKNH
jgi:hypothetical protein